MEETGLQGPRPAGRAARDYQREVDVVESRWMTTRFRARAVDAAARECLHCERLHVAVVPYDAGNGESMVVTTARWLNDKKNIAANLNEKLRCRGRCTVPSASLEPTRRATSLQN